MILFSTSVGAGLALTLLGTPRTVDLDSPPPLVAVRVKALMAGGFERERVERICSQPDLLPYLRQHLKRNPSELKSPGAKAVKLALAKRVLERSELWLKEGRVDLLMEAGIVVAPLDEVTTVKLVNRMYELLRSRLETWHPLPPDEMESLSRCTPLGALKEQKKAWNPEYAHGDRVTIGKPDVRAAFGREVASSGYDVRGLVYAGQGIRMTWPVGSLNWSGVFVCGGEVELPGLSCALVIVDGDVVLPEFDICSNSLVIASGSIYGKAQNTGLGHCNLYAGGDIRVTGTIDCRKGFLRAGGKVVCTNADPEKIANHVNGFDFSGIGLKFLKTEEVGLVLERPALAVAVKELKANSPFRDQLNVGDRLTEINGRKVANIDDARRAIREATVLEYAVVTLKRDRKELKIIVLLPASPR